MKKADKLNARYVLILGEDEIKGNMVTLKNMQTSTQEKINLNEAIERIKMYRTHNLGQLRKEDINKEVILSGWLILYVIWVLLYS